LVTAFRSTGRLPSWVAPLHVAHFAEFIERIRTLCANGDWFGVTGDERRMMMGWYDGHDMTRGRVDDDADAGINAVLVAGEDDLYRIVFWRFLLLSRSLSMNSVPFLR
jgi:hypothetical protein